MDGGYGMLCHPTSYGQPREAMKSGVEPADAQAQSGSLFIAKIPATATEADVESLFSTFGRVVEIQLFRHLEKSWGCGMLVMSNAREAWLAERALDDLYVWPGMSCAMVVQPMNSRRPPPESGRSSRQTSISQLSLQPPSPLTSGIAPTEADVQAAVFEYLSERRQRPPKGCSPDAIKLFVGNVPKHFNESWLHPVFAQFGNIVELVVMRDQATRDSKRSGFVWYSTRREAESAILALHGQCVLPEQNCPGRHALVVRPATVRKCPPALEQRGLLDGWAPGAYGAHSSALLRGLPPAAPEAYDYEPHQASDGARGYADLSVAQRLASLGAPSAYDRSFARAAYPYGDAYGAVAAAATTTAAQLQALSLQELDATSADTYGGGASKHGNVFSDSVLWRRAGEDDAARRGMPWSYDGLRPGAPGGEKYERVVSAPYASRVEQAAVDAHHAYDAWAHDKAVAGLRVASAPLGTRGEQFTGAFDPRDARLAPRHGAALPPGLRAPATRPKAAPDAEGVDPALSDGFAALQRTHPDICAAILRNGPMSTSSQALLNQLSDMTLSALQRGLPPASSTQRYAPVGGDLAVFSGSTAPDSQPLTAGGESRTPPSQATPYSTPSTSSVELVQRPQATEGRKDAQPASPSQPRASLDALDDPWGR